MNALAWFLKLNKGVGGFWSTENPKRAASNSEIRRWFQKGSIIINGEKASMEDIIVEIDTCVIHPNGKARCTIF